MNIEKELRDALVAMDAVTALVSTRIWDEWFRTSTLPAVVYEFDYEDMEPTLEGTCGHVIASVNIICRADTRADSRDLAEAVQTNGTTPGTGLNGYDDTFQAFCESRANAAVPKSEGSNDYFYDTNLDYRIHFYEDV